MSLKTTFLFVFITVLVIYQVNCANLHKRDTKDASNTIDNLINDLKTNFNDLVAKVQNNEQLQTFSNQMKALGAEFADKTSKLAEDTQKAFKAN